MKNIIKRIVLITIIAIIIWSVLGIYKEKSIKLGDETKKENTIENIESTENVKSIENIRNVKNIDGKQTNTNENKGENNSTKSNNEKNNLVANKYKGYKVAANLKIDKLNIDTCVLEDYTDEAMEICVTKFYGPNPNEIGNFCITGHNYITKNMFGYLYLLEIGDTIILTDNKNGKVEYEIYDEYTAKPTQTYGLSQKTDGKREVTLVTCCNFSNDRLVIKAKEI